MAGAKLVISADPNPDRPESYSWYNRWRPSTDKQPNTGPDAVRAINEYDQISDFLDRAKDDFTAVIGTQEKATPSQEMPIHPNAISETIFFGPYRTTLNVPAQITIPFDKEKITNPENITPIVYNELTEEFEQHPKVRNNYINKIDAENGTYTFESQVLGQFALAEINN